MFPKAPKIIGHSSILNTGWLVTPEYIITEKNDNNEVRLMKRYCPHRQYPLNDPGDIVDKLYCPFHGLKWESDGTPIEHPYKLSCGNAEINKSGLISLNWVDQDVEWSQRISNDADLSYSYSTHGNSNTGSWLWLMEAEADYLHVKQKEIHPSLSQVIDLTQVKMYDGDGWIAQEHQPGWTSIFIYPYTFVEHKQGCLSINMIIPHNYETEFGFQWMTQFYFSPTVSKEDQQEFASLDEVFREDVATIEKIKGGYYPLKHAMNNLELHSVHWGEWVKRHRKNI